MSTDNLNSIAERFGFTGEDDITAWSQTFVPDFARSKDGDAYLYTDGDCGLMLIECMSEIFDDQGSSFRLLGCNFCDISYASLSSMIEELEAMAADKIEFLEDDYGENNEHD